MFASLFIIAASLAMGFYWFRYSCALLRTTHVNDSRVERAVEVNGLALQTARTAAEGTLSRSGLRQVQRMLDHDRRILEFLLEQSGALTAVERRMLHTDYLLMAGVCRMGRVLYPPVARLAVREMTATLVCIAAALGTETELRVRS